MSDLLNLLHLSHTKRWVVGPLYREQSVAEHSYRVTVIAWDLCRRVGLGQGVIDAVIRQCLVHDGHEFTDGDCPGPIKSAKPGYLRPVAEMTIQQCVVKVADSIETGTYWLAWGNPSAWVGHPFLPMAGPRDVEKIVHYSEKMAGLVDIAADVWLDICGKGMFD